MKFPSFWFSICSFVAFFSLFFMAAIKDTKAYESEWNGFITTGVARTNTKVLYDGGIDSGVNFTHDFRAGLGHTLSFDDEWSLMLQLLSLGKGQDFDLMVDYAALRWQMSSNFAVRVGKLRLNTWLVSEYIDVGSLYPWIRPPTVVYGFNPARSHLGSAVSISRPLPSSEWTIGTEVFGGWAQAETPSLETRLEGELDRMIGVHAFASNDYLTLRASYVQTRADIQAITPIRLEVSPGVTTKSEVSTPIDFGRVHFLSAGLRMDWSQILFYSEYARIMARETVLKEAQAYYVTLGYYLLSRRLLPHFTFQQNFEKQNVVIPGTEWSTTFGLNYQFIENVIGKLEWQWIHPDGASNFSRDPGKNVHLLGASINASF